MAAIYFDTSAIMRRYDSLETGAAMVRAICLPSHGHDLLVGRHVTVEVASAIGRKTREGRFDARARTRVWRMFNGHVRRQYRVFDLNDAVYARAEQLVLAHALRAFDAIHIACALVVANESPDSPLQFWTADRRQADVATAEGLEVLLVR